jgi:hypothetical protein
MGCNSSLAHGQLLWPHRPGAPIGTGFKSEEGMNLAIISSASAIMNIVYYGRSELFQLSERLNKRVTL